MRPYRSRVIYIICLLTLILALPWAVASQEQGTVDITIYYSPMCSSCQIMRQEIMPPLLREYGDRIRVQEVDISDPEGLQRLEDIETRLDQLNNPVPVVVIEEEMILSSSDIFALEQDLIAEIDRRLAQGETTSAAASAIDDNGKGINDNMPGGARDQAIHIAYVEQTGCDECARASIALQALQQDYPEIKITTFDVARDADLVEAMGAARGLPSERRLIAPSLFIGDHVLQEDDINMANLRPLLAEYSDGGSPAFWEQLDPQSGRTSIMERFQSMGIWAVVLAALIDGVNPCAFATIIFFVSYLAISQQGKRGILLVGLSFAAGVFVAYLTAGLGAMQLLHWFTKIHAVGQILYTVMALGCLVLAALSFRDYWTARRGELHDMSLNLPKSLRRRIHARIRHARGAVAGTAFVSGLAVSLLELACTGQVYLPTISFIIGVPEMRATGIAYLVLYNLIFVLPLILILFLVAYGVSSKQLQACFQRHVAVTKLALTILFLLLGILLALQLIGV